MASLAASAAYEPAAVPGSDDRLTNKDLASVPQERRTWTPTTAITAGTPFGASGTTNLLSIVHA